MARRTPWTPIFNPERGAGAISTGNTPKAFPVTVYGLDCFAVEVGDLVIGVLNYRDDNVNISGTGYPVRDPLCVTASYTQIDADYVWYDQGGNDARCTWKVWEITAAGNFGLQSTLPVSQNFAIRITDTNQTIIQTNRVNGESSGITSFAQSLASPPSGLTVVVTNLAGSTSATGSISYTGGWTKKRDPTSSSTLTTAVAVADAVQACDPYGWPAEWTTFGGYASRMWEFGYFGSKTIEDPVGVSDTVAVDYSPVIVEPVGITDEVIEPVPEVQSFVIGSGGTTTATIDITSFATGALCVWVAMSLDSTPTVPSGWTEQHRGTSSIYVSQIFTRVKQSGDTTFSINPGNGAGSLCLEFEPGTSYSDATATEEIGSANITPSTPPSGGGSFVAIMAYENGGNLAALDSTPGTWSNAANRNQSGRLVRIDQPAGTDQTISPGVYDWTSATIDAAWGVGFSIQY